VATRITYDMETLPALGPDPGMGTFKTPGNITVTCDSPSDLFLFLIYGRQAIDRDGLPQVAHAAEEKILVALQYWCRTGELPSEALAAALLDAQATQAHFLEIASAALCDEPEHRPDPAEVTAAAEAAEEANREAIRLGDIVAPMPNPCPRCSADFREAPGRAVVAPPASRALP
jgi:hypothetical protein